MWNKYSNGPKQKQISAMDHDENRTIFITCRNVTLHVRNLFVIQKIDISHTFNNRQCT